MENAAQYTQCSFTFRKKGPINEAVLHLSVCTRPLCQKTAVVLINVTVSHNRFAACVVTPWPLARKRTIPTERNELLLLVVVVVVLLLLLLLLVEIRPLLWSSGQSSLLQTQGSLVRFPALPDFLRSRWGGYGVHSA
jgi:hypothetical protein